MRPIHQVPTNVIFGFLGVGKTTAVLDWIRQKPAAQSWSVLVNEFGDVGIDGALYERHGVAVKELPGGCMCCAQGVPLQVAVNRLLRETRPDRLLIESSGIGHPAGVLKTLQGEGFEGVLDLKAVIGLVDPQQLLDPACQDNELFTQQLALADVLVANKADLATTPGIEAFDALATQFTMPKSEIASTSHAHMRLDWLDYPHLERGVDVAQRFTLEPQQSRWRSYSWRYPDSVTFDLDALKQWLGSLAAVRIKGFVNTAAGSYVVNGVPGTLGLEPAGEHRDTRLQVIEDNELANGDAAQRGQLLEQALLACVKGTHQNRD